MTKQNISPICAFVMTRKAYFQWESECAQGFALRLKRNENVTLAQKYGFVITSC